MKKNLGKIVLLFFVLQTVVFAQQVMEYEVHASKTEAYVKEPIEITFKVHQKDHSGVMFFFLKAKKSDDYKIKLLTREFNDEKHHDSSGMFKYILFPLKAKKINVNFDFTIKISSDASVTHAYVTDHDESSGIEGKIYHIKIAPIILKIKPLAHGVDLVGDFRLVSKIDTKNIKQYENVNLHYRLFGNGFANKFKLLDKIEDVNLFSDIKKQAPKLTKDGYNLNRDYIYSLSAKHNFVIPTITLKAYSPKRNHFYTLTTPSYSIEVNKIDVTKLLDKEESPQNKQIINWQIIKQFLIYIFIFFSGYIVALLTQRNYKKKKKIKFEDIKESKNSKELILILLNNYKNEKIGNFITELEKVAYGKKGRVFKDIKKSILQEFM
jgi:hypothetical protein